MTAASVTRPAGWDWRRRLPVIVLAAGLVTLAELRVAVTISHSHHAVYRLPTIAVVSVVVAGLVVGVAAVGLTLLPRPRTAILVSVIASLALAGIATVWSIGLVLLPAALIASLALFPALRGARPRDLGLAFLCGVPLAAGLVAVSIISIQPPVVECAPGSVTESDRAWWGSGSGMSSGTDWISPAGEAAGRVSAGGETFVYACRGATLVRFSSL
jgi:hypothetical protein